MVRYAGKLWNRQRDDSGKIEPWLWFDRFDRFYRPFGPTRSILGAYRRQLENAGKNEMAARVTTAPKNWYENSKKWEWDRRAEAYEDHLRGIRLEEEEEAIRQMRERHIALAIGLQQIGGRVLASLSEQEVEELARLVSPTEARHYIRDGVTEERRARQLPEHALEIVTRIEQMTVDELQARYREKLEELKRLLKAAEDVTVIDGEVLNSEVVDGVLTEG